VGDLPGTGYAERGSVLGEDKLLVDDDAVAKGDGAGDVRGSDESGEAEPMIAEDEEVGGIGVAGDDACTSCPIAIEGTQEAFGVFTMGYAHLDLVECAEKAIGHSAHMEGEKDHCRDGCQWQKTKDNDDSAQGADSHGHVPFRSQAFGVERRRRRQPC